MCQSQTTVQLRKLLAISEARKLRRQVQNTLLAGLAILGMVSGLVSDSAQAQNTTFRNDWLFMVESEELPTKYFYRGAAIAPVAKLTVQAAPVADKDNKKPYQKLWFHAGKPIGLERQAEIPVPKTERSAIEITHKKLPATSEEHKAIANVIMRLKLDAYHNQNQVIYIKVPAGSFQQICSEMQLLGCSEQPNGQNGAYQYKMAFFLESQPRGQSQHLFFN